MRALPELLPEIERIDNPPPLPPEATGSHPYLEAMKSDGLLGDAGGVEDCWLEWRGGIGDPRMDCVRRQELARRHANRGHLRRLFSWAIPNEQALSRLAALSPLLELGAGGGYWAKLLRARGAEVVAYDRNPPPAAGRRTGWSWRLWDWVDRGGLEALEQHPDHTLVLCWPSPGHQNQCWAAEALRRAPQRRLVYIGEEADGCTGSRAFHTLLATDFVTEDEVVIPRWSLTDDRVFVLARR